MSQQVQIMLLLSLDQWDAIRGLAKRNKTEPADIVYRMIGHGWQAVTKEVDGVPPPPRRLRLVR